MMADPMPAPRGLSVNDIQTRLAAEIDQWMPETAGRVSVQLTELATLVHEIAVELAERLVDREIAYRYRELAATVRRSSTTAGMPEPVTVVLSRWADALDRRATALAAPSRRPGTGQGAGRECAR